MIATVFLPQQAIDILTLYLGRSDDLTVRELARLQGFPDDFVFYGSDAENYSQVHEAFPPPIAKMLANSITRNIKHLTAKSSDNNVVEDDTRGTKRPGSREGHVGATKRPKNLQA